MRLLAADMRGESGFGAALAGFFEAEEVGEADGLAEVGLGSRVSFGFGLEVDGGLGGGRVGFSAREMGGRGEIEELGRGMEGWVLDLLDETGGGLRR